jgi:Insertion element 4 transposase N-terminal
MAHTKAVLGAGARWADHLAVACLAMNCPLQRVRQVLQELGAQSKRGRDLPAEVLVFYVMALCLHRRAAYEEVLRVVVEGLRSIYGDEIGQTVAGKAAISLGRTRGGADPLARSAGAPAAELAALNHRRWKIEEALDDIKTYLNDSMTLRSRRRSSYGRSSTRC